MFSPTVNSSACPNSLTHTASQRLLTLLGFLAGLEGSQSGQAQEGVESVVPLSAEQLFQGKHVVD